MKLPIYLIFICVFQVAFSQYWLDGTVLVSGSSEPVPYAHVILADSSNGTFSDYDGKFQLRISEGVSEIIVSHVGFSQKQVQLTEELYLNVFIDPLNTQLQDVRVVSEVDKEWKRAFKIFKRELFGYNEFSDDCKILNPWVIDFSKEGRKLTASSDELIEITNEALGYFVQFRLDEFEKKGEDISLKWEPMSIRDLSADSKIEETFQAARDEAYKGSIYHFFKSLFDVDLYGNGFQAFLIGENFYDIRDATLDQIVELEIDSLGTITSNSDSLLIDFSGYLQVLYRDPQTRLIQSSWLECKSPAPLDEQGYLYDAVYFSLIGRFSHERLSHFPFKHQIVSSQERKE